MRNYLADLNAAAVLAWERRIKQNRSQHGGWLFDRNYAAIVRRRLVLSNLY